jgi:hypothetical protein
MRISPSFGDSKVFWVAFLHETINNIKVQPIKKVRIVPVCYLIGLIILFYGSEKPKSTINQAQSAKNESKIIVNI